MVGRLFSGIFLFITIVFMSSCNSRSCTDEMTSKIHLGLYGYAEVNSKKTLVSFSLDSVIIQGNEQSGFLYHSGKDTTYTKISLPLDQMHDTTVFSVSLLNKWDDQLYVVYKRKNVFVSYDCGFRTEFALDTVWFSNHPQDSIFINQSQRYVSTSLLENCKIIFNSITGVVSQ